MIIFTFVYLFIIYILYAAAQKTVLAPLQLVVLISLLFFADPVFQNDVKFNDVDLVLIIIFLVPITSIFTYEILTSPASISSRWRFTGIAWPVLAQGIVILEFTKRLSFSDFNFNTFFINHLLPRGTSPWDLAQFAGAAHFALIKSLLPFAALVIFDCIIKRSGTKKIYYISIYLLLLFFLFSTGSRAPLFFVILTSFLLFGRNKSTFVKVRSAFVVGCVLFILGSIMVTNRGAGYSEIDITQIRESSSTFHIDNNYSLARYAIYKANEDTKSWDSTKFIATILFNPIPRAVWKNKPVYLEADYGVFKKQWWTTMSFIGEFAALSSNFFIFFSMFFLIIIYCIARYFYNFSRGSAGSIIYFCICIYLHLCTRSLFSISTIIYLPAFAILTSKLVKSYD